jgi:integrase
MSKMSARFVATATGEPGRRIEHPDDLIAGLALRVSGDGQKSWSLRYRNTNQERRRLTLGAYPNLGLKDAREAALAALGEVAKGQDVALAKQTNRRRARLGRTEKPRTLSDLWELYERDVMPTKRPRTRAVQAWLWAKHVQPRLGENALASIDRGMARAACKAVGAKSPVTANRALELLRAVLNWGVAEEYLSATPLARVRKLYAETSRDRVLGDDELRILWRALNEAPGRSDIDVGPRMVLALKLVLLTGTRPGDVVGLDAREVDQAARSWTISAGRFKTKRAHVVPLSAAAWEILARVFDAPPDQWRGPAFPHARDRATPMHRQSMTRAMARIVAAAGLERATPHDLRRTCATYLASERIGAAPHIVSAILGHAAEGPAATQVYIRHRYDSEKRLALEAWAALLGEIVGEAQRPSNVAAFKVRP